VSGDIDEPGHDYYRGGEDDEQAAWLARAFERKVRYDHVMKRWHIWDGIRWAPDKTKRVEEAALKLVRERLGVIVNSDLPDKARQKAEKDVRKLLDVAKLANALVALSIRSDYKTDGADWDQDENLLGCRNGIVDLRMNALVPDPGPELLVTKTTGHRFIPFVPRKALFEAMEDHLRDLGIAEPRFPRFMREITSGDDQLAAFYLLWFGYSLFGHTHEQRFLVMTGIGRNGKGALATLMRRVFGEYTADADQNLYMRSKLGAARSDGARADLMALKGKRIAIMSEPDGGEFAEETLKAHTGGDPITARPLYCLTPGHRVLTRDLRWVPVESLRVGDQLWAFTEDRQSGGHRDRRWCASEVTATSPGEAEVLRILLSSGRSLECTPEHPWLVAGRQGGVKWIEAGNLRIGDRLPRYLDTWSDEEGFDAGWLSGMFDGEGSLGASSRRSYTAHMSLAQREGATAARVREIAGSLGIALCEYLQSRHKDVIGFHVRGGLPEIMKALGRIRPGRLLSRFSATGASLQRVDTDRVIGIMPIGRRPIVMMGTSSRTYLAEGYGSHNSNTVITWTPTHTITFLTNQPPQLRDIGPSMAARIMVADFRERFDGEKEDKRLYDKLGAEAEGVLGILCWAAMAWYVSDSGLQLPERVRKASEEYLGQNDPIGRALAEAFVIERGVQSSARSLYDAYVDWHARSADEEGQPLNQTAFGLALSRKGLNSAHTRSGKQYKGIRPKSAVELADEE